MIIINSKPSELTVIIKTKSLCAYVMNATSNSPKKFRFTLVSKMQTYCLNSLEYLYRANEIMANTGSKKSILKRIDLQHKAVSELHLLAFMTQMAFDEKCILKKEYISIAEQILECKKLAGAWIKSERKRLAELDEKV